MNRTEPLVSVITVNYNGKSYLDGLLSSLRKQSYRNFEIIVVDNNSHDGSVDYLRKNYDDVRIVEAGANLGFAGGNNLGMSCAQGEFYALINNDTVVDERWLEELVSAAVANESVGAFASKILFFKKFLRLRLDFSSSDGTQPLLEISEKSAFKNSSYFKPLFTRGVTRGFFEGSEGIRVCTNPALLMLPYEDDQNSQPLRIRLRTSSNGAPTEIRVSCENKPLTTLMPTREMKDFELLIDSETLKNFGSFVINNAGSKLDRRGNAADRGINERDKGQFDRIEKIAAFCGCSVLLRRSVIDQVGMFDADFFMYYEDTDLSWRFTRARRDIQYVPKSVVYHIHAGSSVEWSPFFNFQVGRNRVLLTLKNAKLRVFVADLARELIRLLRALNHVRKSSETAKSRATQELAVRWKIQKDLVRMFVPTLMKRWGLK